VISPPYVRIRDHTIWATPLKSGAVVLDCGAHRGDFSRAMATHFGANCFLVEANADLVELLRDEFPRVLAGAACATDGVVSFLPNENPEAGRVVQRDPETVQIQVPAFSANSLINWVGAGYIDVLKLDIEGSEFDLLESLSPQTALILGQITVEFHELIGRTRSARRVLRTVEYLHALGFSRLKGSITTYGDYLFINRRRFPSRTAVLDRFAPLLFQATGLRRTI